MNRVRKARIALHKAEVELHSAMKKMFTVGTVTSYSFGDLWIDCEVLRVSWDRVKVRGLDSEKEYWISGYRMRGAWDRA